MTWATLASELLAFTGTTATNYDTVPRFIDLNKSYHFIEDSITEVVGESYFYNEFTTDTTVSGQKEYTLPATISGNLDWVNKTLGISIDYGDGYVKATKVDVNSLEYDVSYYMTNQPTTNPIYTIQDNSVMIFPVPTATTIGDIRMYVVQNLIDITASTAEVDIFNWKIHKKYHPLIELGARQYWYERRQLKDDAEQARQKFMVELFGGVNKEGIKVPGMLNLINTRQRGARIRQMPTWYEVKQ
jgi:hypothetical protein